jgi:hypothetical protein
MTVGKWLVLSSVGAVIDIIVYVSYMKLINNNPGPFTGGVILLVSSVIIGLVFFKFFYKRK